MEWTQVSVTVPRADAERATAAMTALTDGGLYIEDYADLEEQVQAIAHVDLIEEELLARPRDVVTIHSYLSPEENAAAAVERMTGALQAAGLPAPAVAVRGVQQEDWQDAWKQYYHPFEVGRRLAVAPSWEAYTSARTVLRMDPGMAFGTGTHETTLLCLGWLDAHIQGGERVLDIGTGSGILAIAALLLGAKSATATDIDPMAVRTATENAAANGVAEHLQARCGDLAATAGGVYDVIMANIVADAIIRLAPEVAPRLAAGGVFVASGVIAPREGDVQAALAAAGLAVREVRRQNDWLCLACTAAEPGQAI